MTHFFHRRQGELWCEDVPLAALARAWGTPSYVYSDATLRRHFHVLDEAIGPRPRLIAFSVKANSNLSVLATLAQCGAGADVVSGGELARALAAGIPAGRIVFSGVGKTRAELVAGLVAGIFQFNVESAPELEALAACAAATGLRASVAIRVNPDIGAGGHAKISTGGAEVKFGVPMAEAPALVRRVIEHQSLDFQGLAVHIGSQIGDLAPMERAFGKVFALARALGAEGIGVPRIDLGGGLAIPYDEGETHAQPAAYGTMVARAAGDFPGLLIFEPGRLIAGNSGILLSEVIYFKRGESRNFLVLDAGMNDLMRPALYDAFHAIEPVGRPRGEPVPVDVVGPICETSDLFGENRLLPPLEAGDLVALFSAGAYGASMGSEYNSRPLAAEILVRGAEHAVVRRRPVLDEMLAREPLAQWLAR